MTLFSLLYASKSLVPSDDPEGAIAALVDVSRTRNAAADITGCLISADGRFAQILEGKRGAVETLMQSIRRDPRHTDIAILEERPVAERQFAGWALGYAGPSLFVRRAITRTVTDALRGSSWSIRDLIQIMAGFRAGQSADIAEGRC